MCDRLPLLPHLGWAVGARKTAQNGPPAPEIVGCGMPQIEPRGTYGESADATGHVLMANDVVWAHVPTQSRIRVDAVAISREIWSPGSKSGEKCVLSASYAVAARLPMLSMAHQPSEPTKNTLNHPPHNPSLFKTKGKSLPNGRGGVACRRRCGVLTRNVVSFDTSTRYPRAIKARISVKSYLVLHASRTRGETILERIVILLNPFPLDVGARARNRASEKRRLSQNTLHVLRLGTLMHILMIIVLISRFIFRIAFFCGHLVP